MQCRVPAQCAARVCARAHLAYAHEHSIIHYPAGCRMSSRAAQRAGAARVCALARRAYARKQARDTGRAWRAAPERDSQACQPCRRFSPGQNRSGGLGSGPRYQILSHVFGRCASQTTHCHARIARETRFSHGSVLFDYVQKSVTQIIYLGPLPKGFNWGS